MPKNNTRYKKVPGPVVISLDSNINGPGATLVNPIPQNIERNAGIFGNNYATARLIGSAAYPEAFPVLTYPSIDKAVKKAIETAKKNKDKIRKAGVQDIIKAAKNGLNQQILPGMLNAIVDPREVIREGVSRVSNYSTPVRSNYIDSLVTPVSSTYVSPLLPIDDGSEDIYAAGGYMSKKKTRKYSSTMKPVPGKNLYGLGSFYESLNGKIDEDTGKYTSGIFKGASAKTVNALTTAANAANQFASGFIAGDLSTPTGDAISGLSNAASAFGPVGSLIGGGLNLVGGLVNRAFGSKLNQEKISEVNSQISNLNSFNPNASNFDDLATNSGYAVSNFTKDDIGSDGWFSNKASDKYDKLKNNLKEAQKRADVSVQNNLNNLVENQAATALANYSAFGGPLSYSGYLSTIDPTYSFIEPSFYFANGGGIHIKEANRGKFTEAAKRAGMGVQEYASHVLANKDKYSPTMVKRANFARNAANWHAFGGDLQTKGSTFPLGYTYIDNGGSHEANPNDGVQMGVDAQGTPNLVEEGEVVYDNYVFSNRLNVPQAVRTKYKLRGTKPITFAEAFKKLAKESEERPNDPISNRNKEAFAGDLMMAQEQVRIAQEDKKLQKQFKALPTEDKMAVMQQAAEDQAVQEQAAQEQMAQQEAAGIQGIMPAGYAYGGRLGNMFDGTGNNANYLANPFIYPWNLSSTNFGNNPYHGVYNWYPWEQHVSITNTTPDDNTVLSDTTSSDTFTTGTIWHPGSQKVPNFIDPLMYAPILGSTLGLSSILTKKTDYSSADTMEDIANRAGQYNRVKATPIGNYLTYNPLDRQYAINLLNAQQAANRRGILNTAGGNRGTAMAGLLAADYNAGNQIGTLFRQAEESNREQRQKVAEFNRATDQYNAESALKAAMANQSTQAQAAAQAAALMTSAVKQRQAIDDAKAAALAANYSNLFGSIGDIGKQSTYNNMIVWMANKGLFGNLGTSKKSKGGYLTIKNKRR